MTSLLESAHVQGLSREESVRGVLVRMVLEQVGQADSDERVLLENALHLLLERFQALEDAAP